MGKGDGIARGTIVQVGPTIETFHLFIDRYHRVGGMTIGSIVGESINGTTNVYPTKTSNGTGATGKGADIGKRNIVGESKVCSPAGKHHNNLDLNLDRKKLNLGRKEERKKNMIEIRMTRF